MRFSKGNLSVTAAILIGSTLISLSILLSGGVIKIKGFQSGNLALQNTVNPSSSPTTAGAQPTAPQPPKAATTVAAGHLPYLGSKDAPVTLVEFADFRCPFCQRFFNDTEQLLIKNYVNAGKVRLAFRQYAFLGPASTLAANASECANEQNKFWDFHDYLYKNQPPESDISMYSVDKLTSVAQGLGLSGDQFRSCLQGNKYNSNVSTDFTEGQKDGVSATPSVFVGKSDASGATNAIFIEGAQPLPNFQSAIDSFLK